MINHQLEPGKSPQDLEHVGDGRAFFAGDEGDAHRIGREGLLAIFFEEPFLLELFAELAESQLQRALAYRQQARDLNLVFALRAVDADPPGRDQFHSIFWIEFQTVGIGGPHDTVDAVVRVLEAEIEMAGLGQAQIAHLTLHLQDAGEGFFDGALDLRGQLGDGEDLARDFLGGGAGRGLLELFLK